MYTTTNIPEIYLKNVPQPDMNFKYLPKTAKLEKCMKTESSSIFLLKTARNARHDRYKIRRLFGKQKNYYFMMGTDQHQVDFAPDSDLEYERNYYDDIVIANFIDTYNLGFLCQHL